MVDTPAMSGRVKRVSIAPVKSLGLSHPDTVELTTSGVVGDRRFWMITGDGRLVNGKLCPELMQIQSTWEEARMRSTSPGGTGSTPSSAPERYSDSRGGN